MKWLIYLFILILIPSLGIYYKCHSEIKRQLNIHSVADKTDSILAKNADTKYFQSSSNQKLAYWYFPVKNSKAVVILVHGFANPGGKIQMIAHAEYLKKAGYTTIIPDLRSFGDSEGEKIYLGTREWQDLVDTYNLVKSFPENKDKKIGYLGVSMGAASAITAISQSQKGDFLIASVPFKSAESLAEFRYKDNKYLPILKPFIKLAFMTELGPNYSKYSAINNIANIYVPVLIFQAQKDEFINKDDPKDLYDLALSPKEFWSAPAPHDIHYYLPVDFQQHVLTFLSKIQ
jgi:esterase/lipase